MPVVRGHVFHAVRVQAGGGHQLARHRPVRALPRERSARLRNLHGQGPKTGHHKVSGITSGPQLSNGS
jgi:hypothetical protein